MAEMTIEQQKVLALAAARMRAAQAAPPDAPAAQTQEHTIGQKIGMGAGDTPMGVGQLNAHIAPDSTLAMFAEMSGAPAGALSGQDIRAAGDRAVTGRENKWQAERGPDDKGFEGWRAVGNALSTAPLAAAIPPGSGFVGGAISGAGQGFLSSAAQPVTGGNYAAEKTKQIGIGTGLGGIVGGILGWMTKGRPAAPSEYRQSVNALQDAGIQTTPAQTIGPNSAKFEDVLSNINPAIGVGQKRALDQFNTKAADTVLDPLKPIAASGLLPDSLGNVSGKPGRSMAEAVYRNISDAYDEVLQNLTFKADGQLGADVANIRTNLATYAPDKVAQFDNVLKANNQIFAGGNALTGEQFKALEEEIGKVASKYAGSQGNEGLYGEALTKTLGALRSNLERANPDHAPVLQAINESWSRYVPYLKAVGGGDVSGKFTPAQLARAIKGDDITANKFLTAQGNAGPLQNLALHGQRVLGNTYPNSGTIGRALGTSAALGTGGAVLHVNPYTAIPLVAGSLAYTPYGQRAAGATLNAAANAAPRALGLAARAGQRALPVAAGSQAALIAALMGGGQQ